MTLSIGEVFSRGLILFCKISRRLYNYSLETFSFPGEIQVRRAR